MNKMEKMLDTLEKWSRESNEQKSPAVAVVILAKDYGDNIKSKAGVLGDTGLGREVFNSWFDDDSELGVFFRTCYEDRLQKVIENSRKIERDKS